MKEKIILLLLFFLAFSGSLMAQVQSISISKNGDMNFGTMAVSSAGGAVVLSASGSRTASGGLMLPSFSGTVSTAQFTVTGEPNYTYTITLPAPFELTTASAGTDQTMTVNAFNSTTFNNGSSDNTGVLIGGTDTVSIGATLNVSGSQTAGSYTNTAGFEVTVNYN